MLKDGSPMTFTLHGYPHPLSPIGASHTVNQLIRIRVNVICIGRPRGEFDQGPCSTCLLVHSQRLLSHI